MTTATITTLRAKGWTAKNNNGKGCSSFWTLRNPNGAEFEVDLGEQRRWIVAYMGGREGFDTPTLGEALGTLLLCYSDFSE